MSDTIIKVAGLRKAYAGGTEALKGVDLDIRRGEILALLGPNGAGKTTLISIICGIVTPSGGTVTVGGHDNQRDYRAARSLIGKMVTIAKVRGTPLTLADGSECWVTIHPSYLLRLPDEAARRVERARFVEDLKRIRDYAERITA